MRREDSLGFMLVGAMAGFVGGVVFGAVLALVPLWWLR